MSVNVELLRKTLAQIEAHPELWEQDWWREEKSCGTAYCFAGWAAVLSGAAFVRDQDGEIDAEHVIPPGGGDSVWIHRYAGEALGISRLDAAELFWESNTLDDLRHIVGDLTDGA